MTLREFTRAERYLLESFAALFAAVGAERARARAALRYDIERFRIVRREFYGSKTT